MRPKIKSIIGLIGGLLILTSLSLYSIPRLAVDHAAPCITCHVSPNGGGIRNEFGNAVAYNELCLESTKKIFNPGNYKPRLSEGVNYGLDYRLLYDKNLHFFRMQSDFYLSLELLKHTTFNFTIGQSNIKDSYLLLKLKDSDYWFKVGRFYPAFGLRDPDHTAYVRTVAQLGPESTIDGICVGGNFFHGSNITVEFYQPQGQKVATFHSFRAGQLGKFGFLAGISWRESEELKLHYNQYPVAKSFFGGLSYDHFTAMGEVQAVGKANEQRTFYAQLAVRIIYGLCFLSEYNFHDPDWNTKSGTNQFYRFSFEFFPLPFIEFRPSATLERNVGDSKFHSHYMVQLHVNY